MPDPLLYAQCWEDPAILRRALRVGSGEAVLSIASAGDNTLSLLLDDPASVTAVDRNATQLELVRLKLAALTALDRRDALELLGAVPSRRRAPLFRAVRGALPPGSRAFWDAGQPRRWIEQGVLGAGRFERYFALFRTRVLPLVHRRDVVERLLGLDDPAEQERFYREVWDTPRWRFLFRIFFGRFVMERLGRQREFFAQVAVGSVGDRFRERARRALVEQPVRDNPFLCWILTGEHRADRLLPPWLQPGGWETAAARAGRLRLAQADLTAHLSEIAPGSYDAFNLSDVFEYLDPAASAALYRAVARSGRPGARLCHWNLLVPRERPADLAPAIAGEPALEATLHPADRCFFYERVVVERLT